MKKQSFVFCIFALLLSNNMLQTMEQNQLKTNLFKVPRQIRKKGSGRQKKTLQFYSKLKPIKNQVIDFTQQQRLDDQLQKIKERIEEMQSAHLLFDLSNSMQS